MSHVQAAQAIPAELRAACAPFFEQMLTVLHDSKKTQMDPGSKLAEITQAMVHRTSTFLPCVIQSATLPLSQFERMLDDKSTEADEFEAFACLLSSPSSECENLDAEVKSSGTDGFCAPPSLSHDLDESSEVEKSNMVCRHWKSKGWCRLGTNCKFLHPEHKRGVTATDPAQPDGDLTGARRRRRGGKNRSNRNKEVEFGHAQQEMLGPQQSCFSDEYPALCFPSALVA